MMVMRVLVLGENELKNSYLMISGMYLYFQMGISQMEISSFNDAEMLSLTE